MQSFLSADNRLKALLPTTDPIGTLEALTDQLRTDEIEFLEAGSELYQLGGHVFTREGEHGAAWAASLAVSVTPSLFGLPRSTPAALARTMPRALFRQLREDPDDIILRAATLNASHQVYSDLLDADLELKAAEEPLKTLYASSNAPKAWALIVGLGPLTRFQIARALGVTPRTASQAVEALAKAGLIQYPQKEAPAIPTKR